MTSKIDVEFLLTDDNLPSGPVIYAYRTGVFLTSVRRKILAAVEKRGGTVMQVPLEKLNYTTTGMFDDTFLLSVWPGKCDAEVVESALQSLISNMTPALCLVPRTAKVQNSPSWAEAKAACLVLEEAAPTEATLPAIADHCANSLGMQSFLDKGAKARLLADCRDLILDRPLLNEVVWEVEERLLLQVADGVTKSASTEPTRAARQRVQLTARLLDLVQNGQMSDGVALLLAVNQRNRRLPTASSLLAELARATARILTGATTQRGARSKRQLTNIALWGVMLLARQHELNLTSGTSRDVGRPGPDTISFLVDQLIRDFVLRASFDSTELQLEGIWRSFSQALASVDGDPVGPLARARIDVLQGLVDFLQPNDELPSELRRILALARSAIARADVPPETSEVASAPSESLPRQQKLGDVPPLSSLVGQPEAVHRLRRRVLEDSTGAVLLSGPAGIGKGTMARAYGKALLCERPATASTIACGECGACRAFDRGDQANFVEFDLSNDRHAGAAEGIRRFADQGSLFGDRQVILMENMKDAKPGLVELFLKTIEEPESETYFIITASEVAEVGPAVLSRSDLINLRPLSFDDSIRLLEPQVPWATDHTVLELIASVGGGLPGVMWANLRRVGTPASSDIAGVKASLGLDWGETVLQYFADLLHSAPRAKAIQTMSDASAIALSEHVREHLVYLTRIADGEAKPTVARGFPAFMSIDETLESDIEGMLASRAEKRRLSPRALLQFLMEAWSSTDITDRFGLVDVERKTRRILALGD